MLRIMRDKRDRRCLDGFMMSFLCDDALYRCKYHFVMFMLMQIEGKLAIEIPRKLLDSFDRYICVGVVFRLLMEKGLVLNLIWFP
jgi:hypothetical protein